MQHALVMGLGDFLRQQNPAGQVPGHLTGDIIPLGGGNDGIFIAVFLGQFLVGVVEQAEDAFVGGVLLPNQGAVIAVDDVVLGQNILVLLHQLSLHHVLNVLHQQTAPMPLLNGTGDPLDHILADPFFLVYRVIRLLNGGHNFAPVKSNN